MFFEKAARLSHLMGAIGAAVWQLQELETLAASYLVIRVKASRGMGLEKGEALLTSAENRTLGQLLGELEGAGVVPDTMGSRLRAVLDDRNWLVHWSRRENRGVLEDPEAYARLTRRLNRMSEEALELLKQLGLELETYVVSEGVSRAQIEADAERIARSWGPLREELG